MMGKGYSLHIGLNELSRKRYYRKYELPSPENDAKAMQALAQVQGFETTILLTKQATAGAVIAYIAQKSVELSDGDYLIISFSGHGKYIPDYASAEDEDDKLDETWCLYDRMIIDDEILLLCNRFKKGVRILFISDSCHSGTMLALMSETPTPATIVKTIPAEAAIKAVRQTPSEYLAAKFLSWIKSETGPKASIELLAACQDDKKAYAGEPYSYFTQHLLNVWNNGVYEGNLPEFYLEIKQSMKSGGLQQVPQRQSKGLPHQKFTYGNPFVI